MVFCACVRMCVLRVAMPTTCRCVRLHVSGAKDDVLASATLAFTSNVPTEPRLHWVHVFEGCKPPRPVPSIIPHRKDGYCASVPRPHRVFHPHGHEFFPYKLDQAPFAPMSLPPPVTQPNTMPPSKGTTAPTRASTRFCDCMLIQW